MMHPTQRRSTSNSNGSSSRNLRWFFLTILVCGVYVTTINLKEYLTLQEQQRQLLGELEIGQVPVVVDQQGEGRVSGNGSGSDDMEEEEEGASSFPAYPRWGDEEGIPIDSILEYLDYSTQSSTHLDAKYDLLDPTFNPKRGDFSIPSLLYVWGASPEAFNLSAVSGDTESYKKRRKQQMQKEEVERQQQRRQTTGGHDINLWVEFRRRNRVHQFILKDRYIPMEELLAKSIDYLLTTAQQLSTQETSLRWKRLQELLLSSNSSSSAVAGIPMILKLDDNRLCSQNNLPHLNRTTTIPVWRLSVHHSPQACQYDLALPTYTHLQFIEQHTPIQNYLEENQQKYGSFDAKNKSIIWRGSMTLVRKPYEGQPRNKMILQANSRNSSSSSSMLDVKIVGESNSKHAGMELMQKGGARFTQQRIPFEDFQYYAGIIDVDGNAWSERFTKLLCFNSVVLKVEPEFVDFLMPQLEPWKHYIPVRQDSSDLWEKAQYVLDPANQQQIQQIISNANQWCLETMTYQNSIEYVLDSLEAYVQLLDKGDSHWYKKWNRALQNQLEFANHEWSIRY